MNTLVEKRSRKPERGYDLWHDREVLHFMVDDEDRRRYHAVHMSAVKPRGHSIIATFAPTGPEFQHVEAFAFDHVTPGGATQRFQAGRLQQR